MPKVEVVKKVTIPTHFTLDKQFYQKAARRLWFDQSTAISPKQIKADGSALNQNAPSTKKLKSKRGQPQLSLVDGWRTKGEFFQGTLTRNTLRGKVKLRVTKQRKRGSRGHQTANFHFVGKKAFKIQATNKFALVFYKAPDAEQIIIALEKMGYRDWISIRKPTQKNVLRDAVTALRTMIKKDVKKRGK